MQIMSVLLPDTYTNALVNTAILFFFFCILLFLFVSYTKDKQRNTIMLKERREGGKEAYYIINRYLHTLSQRKTKLD